MHYDPSMLNIGCNKQLLIDDLVIESVENVRRTWHCPQVIDEEPVIRRDRPWEHKLDLSCNTFQVLRDPDTGTFKCWYTDWKLPTQLRPEDTTTGDSTFHVLYAESEDGVTWHKPEFDIFPVDGKPTNIVLPYAYNLAPVVDIHEPDPDKRYKAMYTSYKPADSRGGDIDAVGVLTSPDGIHWTAADETATLGGGQARLDDVIIMHYEPTSRMFVMTTRHYDMYAIARETSNPTMDHFMPVTYPADWRRMNRRRIWQALSADGVHWSQPYLILSPEDGLDDLDETFYGLGRYPVGNITIGLLNVLWQVPNTFGVRLVYSRDGHTWEHLNKRQPFISPRGQGHWDTYMASVPFAPIEADDKLYFYIGASNSHHDWFITGGREGIQAREVTDPSSIECGVLLAKMRLDGFASLEAQQARAGIVITRPLISDGSKLIVNACCNDGGSIRAEITDMDGTVLPGFERDNCDVFTGDSVQHTFSWKNNPHIPVSSTSRVEYPYAERDRYRKIRFFMENARLYAFALA